jgi:uncharacterized protein YbcI
LPDNPDGRLVPIHADSDGHVAVDGRLAVDGRDGNSSTAAGHYSVRAAISNAVVRIHARSYGRGPTKARTVMGDDYAVCILENIYTAAERTLIDAGRADQISSIRATFQEVARDEFVGAVEEITGRRVRAFLSQVHQDPDVGIEVFLFDPVVHAVADPAIDGDGR